MSDTPILPGARAAFVNPDGTPSRPFYDYLRRQSLASNGGSASNAQLSADVVTLAKKLGADDGKPESITLPLVKFQGFSSLFASQKDGLVSLSLTGDADKPGNTYFYGTSATGGKGWRTINSALAHTADTTLSAATDGTVTIGLADLANSGAGTLQAITRDTKGRITGIRDATITGTAGRVTVANGNAAAGVPTIDLATVADAGGGALLRFVRDAWGRITGTSAATTSDLTEGTNLYFTDARVRATALTGLSVATATAVTATDSVLVGIGKLQGQATAIAPAIAGKEPTIAAGTSTQYWRGDKSWQTLDKTSVGLGSVDNTSDTSKPVSTAQAAALALKLDSSIPAGYIDGLKMVWNSGTSISVTSGAAYIQGSGAVVSSPSTLTLSGLSLAASTWYHVYLYLNAGVPAIECVTTAPSTAYSGTARTKIGDTSRRYVGSVLTDSSGSVFRFVHLLGSSQVLYNTSVQGTPFTVVNAIATSATSVSCAGVIPVTGTKADMTVINNDTSVGGGPAVLLGTDVVPPTASPASWIDRIAAGIATNISMVLGTNQTIQYTFNQTGPTGNFVARVKGYGFDR